MDPGSLARDPRPERQKGLRRCYVYLPCFLDGAVQAQKHDKGIERGAEYVEHITNGNKGKEKVFNFLLNKTMQIKTTTPDRTGTDSSLVIQHQKRGAGIPMSGIQNAYRDGCPS